MEFRQQGVRQVRQTTPSTGQTHPQTHWSRLVLPPETSAATKVPKSQFSQKYTGIPVPGAGAAAPIPIQNPPKPKIQKISDDVTSVSAGETSSYAANDYQNIRNHARGNSRANGGVAGDVDALFCRPPIFQISGNFRKSPRARTPENQGTQGPFLALECKCAFGAKTHLI